VAGLVMLPTNWIGVLLIIAAMVMLLLDLKVTGFVLSIAGFIAFLIGSLVIFTPFWQDAPANAVRLSPWLAIGTTLTVEAFFILGLTRALKAQSLPVAMGSETLIGKTGVVVKDLDPAGVIRVESEEWSAESADGAHLRAGAEVVVVALEGLSVRVAPLEDDALDGREMAPGAGARQDVGQGG
jgi:membrane-bound serine protease (ClpP class)